MRVFSSADNIAACIAGEIINLQYGRLLCENGRLICADRKKAARYPVIKQGARTIHLRVNSIYVFAPRSVALREEVYLHVSRFSAALAAREKRPYPFRECAALRGATKVYLPKRTPAQWHFIPLEKLATADRYLNDYGGPLSKHAFIVFRP